MKETEEKEIEFEYLHNKSESLSVRRCSIMNTIILNISQRVLVNHDGNTLLLSPYSLCVIPHHETFELELGPQAEVILVTFSRLGATHEKNLIDFLHSHDIDQPDYLVSIKMDSTTRAYACSLIDAYLPHLDDDILKEVKFKELIYILCNIGDMNEIAAVLKPTLNSRPPEFKTLVIEKYQPKHNVKSLANACGYSLSYFGEIFRKEFKMQPKEWIQMRLASIIEDKILYSDYSIQDISDMVGMSSPQQMTRFCKNAFGMCPTELRDSIRPSRVK